MAGQGASAADPEAAEEFLPTARIVQAARVERVGQLAAQVAPVAEGLPVPAVEGSEGLAAAPEEAAGSADLRSVAFLDRS